jgi:hypothetical protein
VKKHRTVLQSNGRQIFLRAHTSKRGKLYWRRRVEYSPRLKP